MHFPGVALVTGAGSGIGRATARLFAKEGCRRLAIADVNAKALHQTGDDLASQYKEMDITAIPTDVTDESSVNAMVSTAVSKYGRIDYACNIAGILIPSFTIESSLDVWDRQHAVNTRGMYMCQRAQLRQMVTQEPLQSNDSKFPSRGAIANVASMAGLRAYDNIPAYCASKYGIVGFTKSDGLRHAKDLIRVNAICPGVIKTPMLGEVRDDDDSNVAGMVSEMAFKRTGLPEEVAECLVWIVSGRASFVTATTLAPNGGMLVLTFCEISPFLGS